jgi:biopolymer transport protein ExbD
MGGSSQGSEDDLITAINVTPLVDIVLVLLIILMVTASYIVNKSINVDLPKAATGEATTSSLSISIDVDGKLYLDGVENNEPKLQAAIRKAYGENNDVKAIISADGRVRHAQVVRVIDMLRREHVTKFAINTSPVDLEPKK